MAFLRFSALRDGQSVTFVATRDVLNFDQTVIAAADLRISASGANTRIEVVSGPHAGKDILLLNTTPLQVSKTNVTFADGSKLLVGDQLSSTTNDNAANNVVGTGGRDHLAGLGGNDTLNGGAGNDYLDGGSGVDSMIGGTGNDTYVVTSGDILVDSGGVDTVRSGVSWTLGSGFENLTLTGSNSINGVGNAARNEIIGNSGSNFMDGRAGNDFLLGGGGNDRLLGGDGEDLLDGNLGDDSLEGGLGIDNVFGGSGNDSLRADAGDDFLNGGSGNDSLNGGSGNDFLNGDVGRDTLTGGTGVDRFRWQQIAADGPDLVTDFASGTDRIEVDPAVKEGVPGGAPVALSPNDPRFHAFRGATKGHDADDRVIYDTSTGNLYYDADGSGAGAATHVFTLQGAPTLTATDIVMV